MPASILAPLSPVAYAMQAVAFHGGDNPLPASATSTVGGSMYRINRSIDIKAPVAQVFTFFTNPTNLPTVWPSLVEVTNIKTRPDGSHTFDWTYKMAGVRLVGETDEVQFARNKYVEARNSGAISAVFKWTYETREKGTRINAEVEYTIPAPVIGRLAEAVVAKLNERELETLLSNVKLAMESANAGRADGATAAH